MDTGTSKWSARGWDLRSNLLSSVVVFLVALPLCMAVAIAAGAPVATGLVSGIIGGLVVGILSGSPLQVSGPTVGQTVVIAETIRLWGLPALGIVVLLAGVMQLTAALAGLGQWFRAVSPAVVEGMLAGIGVLIVASQFHVMVDDAPRSGGLANLASIPEAVVKGLPLPAWESNELRSERMWFLKDFGELHEDQVEIEELVDESTPLQEADVESIHWSGLLVRQRSASAALEHLAGRVRRFGGADQDQKRGAKLQAAIDNAEVANQKALAALEAKDPASARSSQREAVVALHGVLEALKNHDWAAKVGLATIAIIVLWQSWVGKKIPLIPAPLAAVAAATAISAALSLPVLYVEAPTSLADGLHFPSLLVLKDVPWTALVQTALAIALLASAETLLCSTAVDQMHPYERTNYDRELRAQGIGNIVSGFLGGLPTTGVIVRSAANVQAGATNRLSTILHGVWLLLVVVFFRPVLTLIPTSCLAGVLVYTGYRLVNYKTLVRLAKTSKGEAFVYLATLATIVAVDLLTGVITGVVLSAVRLLLAFSRMKTTLRISQEGRSARLSIEGSATFLRLPQLARELDRVPADAALQVDLSRLSFIDHACLELVTQWAHRHTDNGGSLEMDWDELHARFRGRQRFSRRNRRSSASPR